MKQIKDKLEEYYKNITEIFDKENTSPKLLHKRHRRLNKKEDEELLTGIIITILIITIILSFTYYFLVYVPQQEELDNIKQEKINTLNTLLPIDEEHNKEVIIAEIESANKIDEVDQINIENRVYPILKNTLLNQLQQYKDKYNRIELTTENTTDIMNINNATNYINTQDANVLSTISIKQVDSVIIPLSINRKQAASGFITQGDIVDIYQSHQSIENSIDYMDDTNESLDVSNSTNDQTSRQSTKIVGGATVVSILRSKDSGNIEQNMQLSQSPNNRNLSQTSTLNIQEILSSKAVGTYDEKQIKLLLDEFGIRLANYERSANIGDLDVEYIVMLEVPRDSAENLIENMDNIILTIPTYDAPSWVKL